MDRRVRSARRVERTAKDMMCMCVIMGGLQGCDVDRKKLSEIKSLVILHEEEGESQ